MRQFYQAQAQNSSLSILDFESTSADLDDGVRVTYTRNYDLEIVELDVTGSSETKEQPGGKDEYWQWAIIETTIPDIQELTYCQMSAFMNPKPKNKQGLAKDKVLPYDTDKPPLSYAVDSLVPSLADIANNDHVSSLLVDLRPYPGGVKFDLYGIIHKYQDGTKSGPNTSASFMAGRKAGSIGQSGTWHNSNGGSGAWYTSGDVSGRTVGGVDYSTSTTIANVEADFPETNGLSFISHSQSSLNFLYQAYGAFGASGPSYAGQSFTWTPGSGNMPTAASLNVSGLISAAGGLFSETTTFGADGIVKKVRGLGAMDYYTSGGSTIALNGAGPTDSQGNWGISFFDYTRYFVGDHPQVPNWIYPSRDATIRFAVFDGKAPDACSNQYGSPLKDNNFQWEESAKFPNRWKFKDFQQTAHMVAVDDPADTSVTNHFGMIKLGTVIINPKKGKGGIKFTPA